MNNSTSKTNILVLISEIVIVIKWILAWMFANVLSWSIALMFSKDIFDN